MKFLFGTDLTLDRRNYTQDGLQYRKATLDPALEKELFRRRDAVERLRPFTFLPKPWKALKWIFWLFGSIYGARLLCGVVPPDRLASVKWITGIGLTGGLLLTLVEGFKSLAGSVRPAVRQARREQTAVCRQADAWLGVPANAKKADVLAFEYTMRNGEISFSGPCRNKGVRIYRRSDMLCLSDGEAVWTIPIDHVTGIVSRTVHIELQGWNKGDSPTLEKYRQAGLFTAKDKSKTLECCLALEWNDGGELWQLLFPAWEQAKMESILSHRKALR